MNVIRRVVNEPRAIERSAFMKLPPEERRRRLAEQAARMEEH